MNDEQRKRLDALRQDFCSDELADALYGIGDPPADDLMGRFRVWCGQMGVIGQQPGKIARAWLETFFQRSKLLPRRWAAARLGMTERSFRDATRALIRASLLTEGEVEPLSGAVSEAIVRGFRDFFPRLARKSFADHDSACRHIHEAIRMDHGIDVEPLLCVTSVALGEDPPLLANEFDAITGDPVSLRYQVWLDLGKPMNLRPDCCSLKLYWAERDILEPLLFTKGERIEERFGDVLARLG